MKLLNCLDCSDIVSVTLAWRTCRCGKSKARYTEDRYTAEYSGNARLLGIRNEVYEKSLHARNPKLDWHWFEIADDCGTVIKRSS